jgi:FtsZ-binding cell division protein ZapB
LITISAVRLTKPETLSDMLPPQEELEADLARLAEIQELRAENRLLQRISENQLKMIDELRAENERLRRTLQASRRPDEPWGEYVQAP